MLGLMFVDVIACHDSMGHPLPLLIQALMLSDELKLNEVTCVELLITCNELVSGG